LNIGQAWDGVAYALQLSVVEARVRFADAMKLAQHQRAPEGPRSAG